ncbi:hypothetical protein COO60DRAFT_431878 [Scenedesmus sp. NREL 46B-D3]|nr:hypothetical protein COO60DRAFT_431878 [Scenedesmus sp. NREL 46B-D3]
MLDAFWAVPVPPTKCMRSCLLLLLLQVQVWDIKQQQDSLQPSMDPILKISEGIEGKLERLSWDATSKLLAAAAGNDVLVWDISAVKDGKVESFVCMGYEQGARVTCLAFQASGSLLASAADNGQCLVHDVNSFGSNGVVNGLISHVAAASVSSADSGDAVQALAWHPAGMLLLGTEAGTVVALQIQKAPQAQQPPPQQQQQQRSPNSTEQQLPQHQQQQQQQRYKSQDMRRQSNGPNMDFGGGRGGGRGRHQQQGWGGEPLMHGMQHNAADDAAGNADAGGSAQPAGRGRGRDRADMRLLSAPGSYPPFKRDAGGAYPAGVVHHHAVPEGAIAGQSPDHPPAVSGSCSCSASLAGPSSRPNQWPASVCI